MSHRVLILVLLSAFPLAVAAQPSSIIVPDSARSSGMSRVEPPGATLPLDQRQLNLRSDRIGRIGELEANPRPLDGAEQRELRRLREELRQLDAARREIPAPAPARSGE